MSIETSASKHAETDQTASAREAGGTGEAVPVGGHAGAYRLGARLDPSGDVYEASHPRVSDAFVIKTFPRESGEDAAAVAAFSMEAGRVSSLRHANIVHVLDAGILRNGRPFVAMERLLGGTLEDQLPGQGQFSTFQALQVARGLASALSAAHAIGVVHREIRPDNVFVVEPTGQHPGLIALLDFGVSRLTSVTHPRGSGIGSVAMRYLAPEQARSGLEQLDGRTDQFGLAALLYCLLNGSAVDPHSVGPFVRGGSLLDAVLQKALSQRPDDRFPSVALFFKAFEEATFTRFSSPSRDRWVATSEVKSDRPTTTQAAFSQEDIATRKFFEQGDRGEANQWENAPLVAAADADPELHLSHSIEYPGDEVLWWRC